ncbi:MAG: 30S ribosomal protein S12 methylthiotransferase RimO [Ignavibacteria bacterium]|nr:30S ribosomal protein S12 methylthiotransferase RimO [Ignavibacteria bacterium]
MKVKSCKIKIITLGCSKNIVDSEFLTAQLSANNMEITGSDKKADVVIINTCGFINDAKKESVNTILKAVANKLNGKLKKVIVAGCLVERYITELKKEIPEIDKLVGTVDNRKNLKNLLNEVDADYIKELAGERVLTAPSHFSYLKISEGCDRKCSFCVIPQIRGRHRSKKLHVILNEAKLLAEKDVRELIIIAQDSTYWGKDIYGKRKLGMLLSKLSEIKNFKWIRIMYAYPSGFPQDVISVMKHSENICRYIDIPIQHISDNVLKRMKRGTTSKTIINLLEKLRKEIPDIAIRTTLLLGHPGETEKDFEELLNFIGEFKFDRLGTFIYSDEEGTPSFNLRNKIPQKEKLLRQKLIHNAQREISYNNNMKEIEKVYEVLIDGKEKNYYTGRTYKDAPEVDQQVVISKNKKNRNIEIGKFYNVGICDFEEFDLFGKIL